LREAMTNKKAQPKDKSDAEVTENIKRLTALSDENTNYIRKNSVELKSKYAGRFIVVHKGEVVKVGHSQAEVDDYVKKHFPEDRIAIPRGEAEALCKKSMEKEEIPVSHNFRNYNAHARLG